MVVVQVVVGGASLGPLGLTQEEVLSVCHCQPGVIFSMQDIEDDVLRLLATGAALEQPVLMLPILRLSIVHRPCTLAHSNVIRI